MISTYYKNSHERTGLGHDHGKKGRTSVASDASSGTSHRSPATTIPLGYIISGAAAVSVLLANSVIVFVGLLDSTGPVRHLQEQSVDLEYLSFPLLQFLL